MRNHTPPTITQATGKAIRLKDNCFAEVISDSGDTELPFCLPGEEIAFERIQYPKRTNTYFKQVIKPSLERQDPACKHFTACGGCILQHASKGFYKEFKTALLTQAFLDNGLNPYVIEPIKVVPAAQRRRANLEAIKKGDKLFMGFHRLQSHQIIDMYECPVLTQPLQDALPYLRNALESLLEPFQKAKIFVLEIGGLVDIGLEIQGVNQLTEDQRKSLMVIAEQAKWNRLQFRHRRVYDILWQKEPMTINFGKLTVPVDPWAFLQASSLAQGWMQDVVAQTIEQAGQQTKLLDLFCGRGTFSGILLNHGPVDGFEGDPKAITILADAGKDFTLSAHVQDLFATPLPANTLNGYSTVVIDPPRAGAQAQATQLALSTVPLIIYVSCNPHTFARDAKVLEDGGYTLETVHPIDQFLWAAHLEVVGIFRKS
jgi:23S rRNA (uracil1939-C5)-methyltransferase